MFFSRGLPLKCLSIENLIWAGLGVSRTIYVNAYSPNLVFPYFNFLWEAQCKKTPCTMKQSKYFFGIMDEISSPVKLFPILVPPDRVDWSVRVIPAKRCFGKSWYRTPCNQSAWDLQYRTACFPSTPYWGTVTPVTTSRPTEVASSKPAKHHSQNSPFIARLKVTALVKWDLSCGKLLSD